MAGNLTAFIIEKKKRGIFFCMISACMIIILSGICWSMPPVIPSQIDGHVLSGGVAVIGAKIEAFLDTNSNGIIDDAENIYAEFTSLDVSDDKHDGYFRIAVMPEDYTSGITDIILKVSYSGKSAVHLVENITEGTRFNTDINLPDTTTTQDSGSGSGSSGGSGGGSSYSSYAASSNSGSEDSNQDSSEDDNPANNNDDGSDSSQPVNVREFNITMDMNEQDNESDNNQNEASSGSSDQGSSLLQGITGAVIGGGTSRWAALVFILLLIGGSLFYANRRIKNMKKTKPKK